MANTIIIKKSSTAGAVPPAVSLQAGELAVNLADRKLYSKTVGGSVIEIGGSAVTMSVTAPASAADGQLWWDSEEGTLKIYYNDGNTSQWVDAVAVPNAGVGTSGGVTFAQAAALSIALG